MLHESPSGESRTENGGSVSPLACAVLIVVHPGSACGSADFHHGKGMADSERVMLADCVRRWDGAIVVVDSDLSDELMGEPLLFDAIETALADNAARGHHVARLLACDDPETDYDGLDWSSQVKAHVESMGFERAILTGAWYHPDDDGGCVNAVYDVLHRMGVRTDVHDSALSIDVD